MPTAAKGDTSTAAAGHPLQLLMPILQNQHHLGVDAPPGPGRGYFPRGDRGGFVPGFRGGRGGGGFIPSPPVAEEERWAPWVGSKIFYGTPALIARVLHERIWGFLVQIFVTSILAWSFGLAVFRILTSA